MKWLKNIGILLWVIFGTCFLARWWLINPKYFPKLPESMWNWLSKMYGAACCEEQADLEIFVSLSISFLVISLLTIFLIFLLGKIKKR